VAWSSRETPCQPPRAAQASDGSESCIVDAAPPLAQPGVNRNHRSNLATAVNNVNRPELFPSVGGQTINTHWGTYEVAWSWS
jgi:hypothetical protein